jgi:signal peptidase I
MSFTRKILGSWYDVGPIKLAFEVLFIILPVAFLIRTFGFGLYAVPSESMETTLLVGERFFADKASYWFRKPRHGEIISFDDPRHKYSNNKAIRLIETYANWNISNWTKRIIGIPGDTIKGVIEDGHPVVYRNGVKLDESSYVNNNPIIFLWANSDYARLGVYGDKKLYFRTFVPDVPWDKQPYYAINPHLVVLNPASGQPMSIRYPGTPIPGGGDVFEVHLKDNQYWVMGDNRLGSGDSREWGPLDGRLIHGRIVIRIWSIDSDESWVIVDLLKHPIAFWSKIRWGRCAQLVH